MTQARIVRIALLGTLAVFAVSSLPTASIARKKAPEPPLTVLLPPKPEYFPMVGASAPAGHLGNLAWWFRAPAPGDIEPLPPEQSLFDVLRSTGTPDSPKYEASDLTMEIWTVPFPKIRVEKARVVLMPAPDGKSCRFELAGVPFGASSSLDFRGTIQWGTGPFGGDNVELTFKLDDAPVEALRAWQPQRFDPSFRGLLDAHGTASGVVGEATTEEAPATPLKGEMEVKMDWQVLGVTEPVTITSSFAFDDRFVRINSGRMTWHGLTLELRGWFDAKPQGPHELTGTFANVDAKKLAVEWKVPAMWQPAAVLSGSVTTKALKAGEGLMKYQATADSLDVPGVDGYPIAMKKAYLRGSLLAVNTNVSCSFGAADVRLGPYNLTNFPAGLSWWRDQLQVTSGNSKLWTGDFDGSASYKPAEHPAFIMSYRLAGAEAPVLLANVAPSLGIDADGKGSMSLAAGQDVARKKRLSINASLTGGRIANVDLFREVLAQLSAFDPALTFPDLAAVLLPPKKGGAGMRVDTLFFEVDKSGETYELGGIFGVSGELRLDGDGKYLPSGEVEINGSVMISRKLADQLVAGAAWVAPLRIVDGAMFVPVEIRGPLAKPTVRLTAAYGELLARAKKGEAVTAPGVYAPRHVGGDDIATVPGDPEFIPPLQ